MSMISPIEPPTYPFPSSDTDTFLPSIKDQGKPSTNPLPPFQTLLYTANIGEEQPFPFSKENFSDSIQPISIETSIPSTRSMEITIPPRKRSRKNKKLSNIQSSKLSKITENSEMTDEQKALIIAWFANRLPPKRIQAKLGNQLSIEQIKSYRDSSRKNIMQFRNECKNALDGNPSPATGIVQHLLGITKPIDIANSGSYSEKSQKVQSLITAFLDEIMRYNWDEYDSLLAFYGHSKSLKAGRIKKFYFKNDLTKNALNIAERISNISKKPALAQIYKESINNISQKLMSDPSLKLLELLAREEVSIITKKIVDYTKQNGILE